MIYIEYNAYRKKYQEAQRNYNEILSEKEKLFSLTQPRSVDTSQEGIKGGFKPSNPFDEYLMLKEKERLDERLNEAKSILEDRERLLNMKKAELMQSNHVEDKIFRMKFIERLKPKHIAGKVGYSEVHVYRLIKKIRKNLS